MRVQPLKGKCISIFLFVSLLTTTFGQLPYRKDFVWIFQPNQWKFLTVNIIGLAQNEMIVADYTSNASVGTIAIFAEFDQPPNLTQNFPFSQMECSGTRTIAILRDDLELGFPTNVTTIHFGFYNNDSTADVLVTGRVYSTKLIDVVMGERRVLSLPDGQYQFFRFHYELPTNESFSTTLLRMETMAEVSQILNFLGSEFLPTGLNSNGFTTGIPSLLEPSQICVSFRSRLASGQYYVSVYNYGHLGEITDISMELDYAYEGRIFMTPGLVTKEEKVLTSRQWIYYQIKDLRLEPEVAFVLISFTRSPLFVPLVQFGMKYPTVDFHDEWRQLQFLRYLEDGSQLYQTIAMLDRINNNNIVVGYYNFETIDTDILIEAQVAEVRLVNFMSEEKNQTIQSFNGWKYYRLFNNAENSISTYDVYDLVVHFVILSSCNSAEALLDFEAYPTILNSIPWDFVKKGSEFTEYRQGMSPNATYIIGVVNMNQDCALRYNINFTRVARREPLKPPSNEPRGEISIVVFVIVTIILSVVSVGSIIAFVLAFMKAKNYRKRLTKEYALFQDNDM